MIAYAVAQRRVEFGIRIALGAAPWDLVRLVGTQSLRLTTAGIILGLIAARATTTLLRDMVHGVGANDPRVFAATALFLGCVAMTACIMPTLRATKVEPSEALRTR